MLTTNEATAMAAVLGDVQTELARVDRHARVLEALIKMSRAALVDENAPIESRIETALNFLRREEVL